MTNHVYHDSHAIIGKMAESFGVSSSLPEGRVDRFEDIMASIFDDAKTKLSSLLSQELPPGFDLAPYVETANKILKHDDTKLPHEFRDQWRQLATESR
ncbi:MAG: hypothetical protein K0U21_04835 [Proteobacteria bacterium]|nr:hypothetical protein [Pseudomonadota bacterium]